MRRCLGVSASSNEMEDEADVIAVFDRTEGDLCVGGRDGLDMLWKE